MYYAVVHSTVVVKSREYTSRLPSLGAGPPGTSRMIDATQIAAVLSPKVGDLHSTGRKGVVVYLLRAYPSYPLTLAGDSSKGQV